MEVDISPVDTLMSVVAYWHHLNITCPQQLPINGVVNLNSLQETTKVRALVIVFRLLPSSFTYAKILAFNPYVVNISFTCMAMVVPRGLCSLKQVDCYMSKLPIMVQKMDNQNKIVHSSS
jgi:hypothetical protein